jgi:hypothetical protein
MQAGAKKQQRRRAQLALPQTLVGQLFLLAYDRRRHRVDLDRHWRIGLALRAAMLADLYLTGHLQDNEGRPYGVGDTRPSDPVLRAMLEETVPNRRRNWAWVILEGQREAPRLVGSQLEAAGWLRAQPRRVLGIVPATRLRLQDEEMVDGLAVQVTTVLRNAIDGWPADERLVALGLLCVFGQLPAVLSFDEAERHRPELEEMAAAIPPITGMDEAIQIVHGAMTRNYYKSAPYAN